MSAFNEIDIITRADLKNSYLNTVGFGADYILNSSTIFPFAYEFTNRKFDPGKDASTHTIAPGIRQYITKKLYFDGRAGVDFISSFTDKNFIKPHIRASLTNEIDENTGASICNYCHNHKGNIKGFRIFQAGKKQLKWQKVYTL